MYSRVSVGPGTRWDRPPNFGSNFRTGHEARIKIRILSLKVTPCENRFDVARTKSIHATTPWRTIKLPDRVKKEIKTCSDSLARQFHSCVIEKISGRRTAAICRELQFNLLLYYTALHHLRYPYFSILTLLYYYAFALLHCIERTAFALPT